MRHGVSLLRSALALALSALRLGGPPVAAAAQALSTDRLDQPAGKNWPVVGGDWNNTRYSALTQINAGTVKKLGGAWVSARFDEGGTSRVTPVVVNGVMYVTAGRKVYALNAKTGARIWVRATLADTTPVDGLALGDSVPNDRGVGVAAAVVFVGLKDGRVVALDATTGALKWSRQTGQDLPKNGQAAAVPPLYFDGNLLTGLSNGDAHLRGQISELDAATGSERWRLSVIPGPGQEGHETWPAFNDVWKMGGGGVWSPLAIDPVLRTAYAPTGNPVPMFAGDWHPGNNLYTCSVLAVDLQTGQLKWYFQLVHHDVFDADMGTPVILYDTRIGERTYRALAALRADGYLFQFDRETGKPLLPVEERAVPQLPSQKTAPTQPFPVGGETVLMSCAEWKKQRIPSGFALGCMWTAPASTADPQNVLAPFPSVRVTPMAYSPQTQYFYVQGTSMLGWPRRSPDPFFFGFSDAIPGLKAYKHLAAIDARTGRIAWKTPIPASTSQGIPVHLSGGPIATAGGLVVQSLGDGSVAAFDSRTGVRLWQFQTGLGGVTGAPASYEIDSEQYIAIPMGRAVWAFKLGGSLGPAAPPPALPEEPFSGPVVDATEIDSTSLFSSAAGSGPRYFVDEYAFHPYRARVQAGTRVLFSNNGNQSHDMTALDGSWSTGPLSPAQETWVTFDKPGVYRYRCKNHPWVYGQIIVVARSKPGAVVRAPDKVGQRGSMSLSTRASEGRRQFSEHCSSCHGEDLAGRSSAPPLVGNTFLQHWQSAPVADLFNRIKTTMPQASPGSLDRQVYLNIVAYLLQVNDTAPVWDELQDKPGVLEAIVVDRQERARSNAPQGAR